MKPLPAWCLILVMGISAWGFSQKSVLEKRRNTPMVVLNTNRSLNAAKAKRALFNTYQKKASDYDTLIIRHRLRFIELFGKKEVVGQLGYRFIHALFDLTSDQLRGQEGFRAAPSEKHPKAVYENLDLIETILRTEKINTLHVPIKVSNVYAAPLGLYFDIDFQLMDTLIKARLDYRFTNQKSRIIIYHKTIN